MLATRTPLVAVTVDATAASQIVVGIVVAITLVIRSTLSGDAEFVEEDRIALRAAVGTFISGPGDRNPVRIDIEGGGGDRTARTNQHGGHFRAMRAVTATLANGITRVRAEAGRSSCHSDFVACRPRTGDIERGGCTPGGSSHAIALLGRAAAGGAYSNRITAGGRRSRGIDARTKHSKSSPR